MKKILFFAIVFLTSNMFFAQTTKVFFSEYLEGTSSNPYNRALEIYNGESTPVDMSAFIIKSGYSGNNNEWNTGYYTFPEGTVLQPGKVWVLANNGAVDSILAVANDTVYYSDFGYVTAFTGNDTRGLFQIVGSDTLLIDIIGVYQEVPENSGWDVAGVPEATQNHTLVRKSTVTEGTTDWAASAGTNEEDSQWIVYPNDTFIYLGWHNGPVGVNDNSGIITKFVLRQNYPNPFSKGAGGNHGTTINYTISENNFVTLKVYNLLGKEVADLVGNNQIPGNYSVSFNADNLPSGVYFYTLKAGKYYSTKKMVILK